MFKKTKVKQVLELTNQGLSARDISKILAVSRNTVSNIKKFFDSCDMSMDELLMMNDDDIYHMLYPEKFRQSKKYVPVDYGYVLSELSKVGVTRYMLWEEYSKKCKEQDLKPCCYATFTQGLKKYQVKKNYTSEIKHKAGEIVEVDWSGPVMHYYNKDTNKEHIAYLFVATLPYSQYTFIKATDSMNQKDWISCNVSMLEFFEGIPLQIVCDNLKTGVVSHPKHGDIVLNDIYLSFGEHYQIAILPASVRKPKQKASVEGSVGKIARKIIGMLRNKTFNSLNELNKEILDALKELNEKPFQKRNGSRKIIFETEEKPYLRPLPLMKFEIYEWEYHHKVGADSHIWFKKNQYSVPFQYIENYVDIQYDNRKINIFYKGNMIASHDIVSAGMKNIKRTNEEHLPYKLPVKDNLKSLKEKAKSIGTYTLQACEKIIDYCSVKNQAIPKIKSILSLAEMYSDEALEKACNQVIKDGYYINYDIVKSYAKRYVKTTNEKRNKKEVNQSKSTGIIRGSEYYRNEVK